MSWPPNWYAAATAGSIVVVWLIWFMSPWFGPVDAGSARMPDLTIRQVPSVGLT